MPVFHTTLRCFSWSKPNWDEHGDDLQNIPHRPQIRYAIDSRPLRKVIWSELSFGTGEISAHGLVRGAQTPVFHPGSCIGWRQAVRTSGAGLPLKAGRSRQFRWDGPRCSDITSLRSIHGWLAPWDLSHDHSEDGGATGRLQGKWSKYILQKNMYLQKFIRNHKLYLFNWLHVHV